MSSEQTYREDAENTRTEVRRQCPYCDEQPLSRGLYAHVMNSEDDAHGDYRSVPDGFNPREAEIVGEVEVEVEPGGVHDQVQNTLYLCTLCGEMMKGEMGYKVHLAKVAGDDVHPQDIDVEDGHFVKIPADANWEPTIPEEDLQEIQAAETDAPASPDTSDGQEVERTIDASESDGEVPVAALRELTERFDGKGDAYEDAGEEVEDLIARYS